MDRLSSKPRGPLALGIHWAHDSSVSICSPDGVVFSLAEERITRLKHYYGFPCRAIETALEYCGLTAADIDILAFSSRWVFYPSHPNWCVVELDGTLRSAPMPDEENRASQVRSMLGWAKAKKAGRNITRSWGEFAERHYSMQKDFLADLGLMDKRIAHYYVAHHRAHAASCYRLSGITDACVITMDGKGDGISGTIYRGFSDGRMELLRSSTAKDSLGAFYQATTEALGFLPVDGEYKTMGLAALGKHPAGESPFASIVSVDDGVLHSSLPWVYRDYNKANPAKAVKNPLSSVTQSEDFKKTLADMEREDFAFLAQEHCETTMLAYARDALTISGSANLVGAGGVLLNVKANSRIRDEVKPEEFFVFPDSADSGLSAGAAMEALYQHGAVKEPIVFTNPYLGHSYTDTDYADALRTYSEKHGLTVVDKGEETPVLVARSLADGKVVGTFQGRLEMGPRALGNRSVIADARTTQVKDRINLILKGREYFVPFAPIVLESDAHLYWEGSIDYRFMTFAVTASEYAKEAVPAVVHVDGTMRPQVVSEDRNPWLHDLLLEYKKITGIGVLINTSFNRHGLPIVGRPDDALDHLVNQWIDGLVIGSSYVERGATSPA